tara:strand:- start:12200 stop:12310 length:111 start_codon:yes stop_codon:yes gene_type:complete
MDIMNDIVFIKLCVIVLFGLITFVFFALNEDDEDWL